MEQKVYEFLTYRNSCQSVAVLGIFKEILKNGNLRDVILEDECFERNPRFRYLRNRQIYYKIVGQYGNLKENSINLMKFRNIEET